MSNIKKLFSSLLLLLTSLGLHAQMTFPVNGVRYPDNRYILIQNAVIHQDSGTLLHGGQMLIKNGIISAIGKNLQAADSMLVLDFEGKHIYPAFIEPLCSYGMPEQKRNQTENNYVSKREGSFSWNEALRSDVDAAALLRYNEELASKYRQAGFALVQTHQADGISRGKACVIQLRSGEENEIILKNASGHVLSFQKGSSTQFYPGSLMGSIALLRQTYLDGLHYENAIKPKEINLSIEYWNQLQKLPQFFIAGNPLNALRVAKIGKEFNVNYIVVGDGKEYQKLQDLRQSNMRFVIPVNFPAAYDLEDPYDALQIDLSDLKHWELATYNPAMLAQNKLPFVFTSEGLPDLKEFLTNVRKSVKKGLSDKQALYALTAGPAEYLQISDKAGSLHVGKTAGFLITDGELFDDKTQILETWVDGRRFQHKTTFATASIEGEYEFKIDTSRFKFKISTVDHKAQVKLLTDDSSKVSLNAKIDQSYLNGVLNRGNTRGVILLSAWRTSNEKWSGRAQLENGMWQDIQFFKTGTLKDSLDNKEKSKKDPKDSVAKVSFPFTAFGWHQKPLQQKYLIRNATVWTNEKEGILKEHDVYIESGKIKAIGKGLNYSGVSVIDGTGKHLTPGIIDEHSHIAIQGGVNECSHSVTAEVRIGDVIDCEDINIYRQLSGGVTSSQLLHGSCNPVGGQSALIKLRWGYSPEQMKFEGADPFIKFALGENVKRSGGNTSDRFPDTRMGVEQTYMDAFQRAKEYDLALKTKPSTTRRNLQLETLAEIINKKRFITCHSYVQSEINMMMKVAEKFGFVLNTFTHILEGFKVADIMRKHGAGAAGFADWWAYKFEVYEATPYNGAILFERGVITAFNSDDAEMARRLNQEAAKAVMYGGVPEEEALKFVTLNPAKLLHVDHRVGSVKTGKDADLVLWSDHPLSIRAVADMTFVDGIRFFDRNEDFRLQSEVAEERNRLIQKMIKAKNDGEKSQKFSSKRRRMYHCDSVGQDDVEDEDHSLTKEH
ncbi:MAG: amidohydrolase family protein [Saprospiraceae bacterium]|nr:amidohydrolase family protein [Saprospiraceae bacterium]